MLRSLLAVSVAVLVAGGGASAHRAAPRVIHWSGYDWEVRTTDGGLEGPGPNVFSDSAHNVWVDRKGRLHLRIAKSGRRWRCAELTNTQSLGYGTYTWSLASSVGRLDRNVVLGLFTWSDDPAYNDREIDIEVSRFGDGSLPTNAQWTVQPYTTDGNWQRFDQPPAKASTQRFTWTASRVDFGAPSGAPSSWSYTGPDVPPHGDERPHLNLWLAGGHAPANHKTVEVVLSSFSFAAAA